MKTVLLPHFFTAWPAEDRQSISKPFSLTTSEKQMETLKTILPLVGVLLGSVLAGITGLFSARNERKKAIATALCDLLEYRHHVTGVKVVLRELKNRFSPLPLPEEQLSSILGSLMQVDAELHKRYDAAVTVLASIDPFLAFTLRSKTNLPQYIESVRSWEHSKSLSEEELAQIEFLLNSAIAPELDKAVLDLAEKHSHKTLEAVRDYISSSNRLPLQVQELFEKMGGVKIASKA